MAWISRLARVADMSRRSSAAFANAATVVVSFLATPLLDIAFSVLMGVSLSAPDLIRIGYAGSLVGATTTVCTAMAMGVAHDRDQDILPDILLHRRVDLAYWIGTSVPGLVMAAGTGLLAITATFLLDAGHDTALFTRALSLMAPALLSGLLLGIGVGGMGLPLADPYAPVNALVPLLPIIAGVVVPLGYYPGPVRRILRFLPASSYTAALENGTPLPRIMGRETLTAGVWAITGILASILAVHSWRQGRQHQPT